jgi:hypothetical protein
MVRFAVSNFLVAAGLAVGALVPFGIAVGAVGGGEVQRLAEAAAGPERILGGSADMVLRFIQEDGPGSGHVRVELTPETRGLTIFEARSAAQQGFLEALNEPGLGEKLSRIKVVVRLMPASHSHAGPEQTFLFLRKGGNDWTILAGE